MIFFITTSFLISNHIVAQDSSLNDLLIFCPGEVKESLRFNITIKSDENPVDNVTVIFNGKRNVTNSLGIVEFIAPRVLPDGVNIYNITAFKDGYNTISNQIIVENIPQVFVDVDTYNIAENTNFLVTIIDDIGKIVDKANITFNNKEYTSDNNGTAILIAPSVNKTNLFIISASKTGYIENSILVTVYPYLSNENLTGFYIVIVICFVIIFGTILIMYSKYLRKKRINR